MNPPRPYDLLFLDFPKRTMAVKKQTTKPRLRYGRVLTKWLVERKKPVKAPVVDLGAILGG
jgi:hypothetical protein